MNGYAREGTAWQGKPLLPLPCLAVPSLPLPCRPLPSLVSQLFTCVAVLPLPFRSSLTTPWLVLLSSVLTLYTRPSSVRLALACHPSLALPHFLALPVFPCLAALTLPCRPSLVLPSLAWPSLVFPVLAFPEHHSLRCLTVPRLPN
jgi:hypothetical protein